MTHPQPTHKEGDPMTTTTLTAFIHGYTTAAITHGTVSSPDGWDTPLTDAMGLAEETYTALLERRLTNDPNIRRDCVKFYIDHHDHLDHLTADNENSPDWYRHGYNFHLARHGHPDAYGDDTLDTAADEYGASSIEFTATWRDNHDGTHTLTALTHTT